MSKCGTQKAGRRIYLNPIISMTTFSIHGLSILVKGVCQSWSWNKAPLFVYGEYHWNTATGMLLKYQQENESCPIKVKHKYLCQSQKEQTSKERLSGISGASWQYKESHAHGKHYNVQP